MAQFAIRSMQDTRFVLPLAPTRKITVYHGTQMHAWYDIFGLDDKSVQDRTRIEESTVSCGLVFDSVSPEGSVQICRKG